MAKKILAILLASLMIFGQFGCSKKLTKYSAQFLILFDTVTQVLGYAEDEESFTEIANVIYDGLEVYHKLYDIYNDYEGINNIKTINDNAGIEPIVVDQKIIDLLLFAKEMYALTDGSCNIAFGSVLSIWHDYREAGIDTPENAELPPMEELREAAKHTDINDIVIDEAASTVYLSDPFMRLDVGAVAKGYATEQVCEDLQEEGYTNLLLSVGGNVRGIGYKDKNGTEPWNVGIQNPDTESEDAYLHIIDLGENMTIVTSGVYERYYTVDGVQYHHIIDPDTLMPSRVYDAVTILNYDSGEADALSTALFNMSYEEGLALIESLDDTEALWVYPDGSMRFSSGYEAYMQQQ